MNSVGDHQILTTWCNVVVFHMITIFDAIGNVYLYIVCTGVCAWYSRSRCYSEYCAGFGKNLALTLDRFNSFARSGKE